MVCAYEAGVDHSEVLIFSLVPGLPYPGEGSEGVLRGWLGELGADGVLYGAMTA